MSTDRNQIARTDDEISAVCEAALININDGKTRFAGQTYEEGIVAAIDWLIGNTDDDPYPNE